MDGNMSEDMSQDRSQAMANSICQAKKLLKVNGKTESSTESVQS